MGTFNANIYPSQNGLSLGRSTQKWIAYVTNVFGDSFQSNSLLTALSGTVRFASTDFIAWRNNTNSGDLKLGKTGAALTTTPADTLYFSGSGIEGPFISHNHSPASAGEVRLNTSDQVIFRNTADSGDVVGLAHNNDDTIAIGGSAGVTFTGAVASSSLSAVNLNLTTNIAPSIQSVGNGIQLSEKAADGITGNTVGGELDLTAGNGVGNGAGGAVVITSGNGSGTGVGGNVVLNTGTGSTTGSIQTNAKVSKYNNITTVGLGIPIVVATVNLTGQTAAISTTSLYGPSATAAGIYRLSYYLWITTIGNAVNLTATFSWKDGISQKSVTTANIACNGNNASSLIGQAGSITFYNAFAEVHATDDIFYATALSGGIGAGVYSVSLRLEYLG